MGIFEWLFEPPRRDYFDNASNASTSTRETYERSSSTAKRTDVTILNMRVGDYVTYQGIDYYVRQRYIYRAGSFEWLAYQFSDSTRKNHLWLDVEDDDELNIEMTEPVDIPPGVTIQSLKQQKPFKSQGETYIYDEHGYAQVKIEKEDHRWDYETVEYWDYYNQDESKFISFEKWGTDELEASSGHPIREFELEIYPGS